MTKQNKFGKTWLSNKDEIPNFPKHLTPEVIHTALFIHNAPSKEDIVKRVDHCAKLIGDEAMQYAMALLVLPHLIDKTKDSHEYKDWKDNRFKTLN
tara:strand:+ start:1083 stop:1370 length:288 start_codon:yes stop_codon:yes gene_type:complete